MDGVLTYFINRRCKARLLWDLWFNLAESTPYEDAALANDFYPTLTDRSSWIPFSEVTVLQDEDAEQRDREYPLGYRQGRGRLDFYVTRRDFREAFRAIWNLGRKRGDTGPMETHIFGCLRVVLLDDAAFGERA